MTRSAQNAWGDWQLPDHRPLSVVAILALFVAAAALALGPLQLMFLTHVNDPLVGIVCGLALLLSIPALPCGLGLGYVGLAICRPSRRVRGRGLAWLALGLSLAALFAWYAILGWPVVWHPLVGLVAIAVFALIHLLAFAAESSGGKCLAAGLLLSAVYLSLLSCSIMQSREEARRTSVINNLRRVALDSAVP